jgi:hypothetical protein
MKKKKDFGVIITGGSYSGLEAVAMGTTAGMMVNKEMWLLLYNTKIQRITNA